jgi:hypothetical protein
LRLFFNQFLVQAREVPLDESEAVGERVLLEEQHHADQVKD